MTKLQFTEFIMSRTDEFKKTNLMKMKIAQLEELTIKYSNSELTASVETADNAVEAPEVAEIPKAEVITESDAPEVTETAEPVEVIETTATVESVEESSNEPTAKPSNAPPDVKLDIVTPATTKADKPKKPKKSDIHETEKHKPFKERLNETEKLMLQTIPQMPEFKTAEDSVLSKALLAKIEELHGISVMTTRALLVSLKKKEYLTIRGKRSGLTQTTIWLGVNGLRFLGFTKVETA